ncbi:MAG: hypothetical protein JHC95_02500 [Solirubrobacteraceae bacterium]|nr:hypothetical protein [Solirubrobacteraceae bacterium]
MRSAEFRNLVYDAQHDADHLFSLLDHPAAQRDEELAATAIAMTRRTEVTPAVRVRLHELTRDGRTAVRRSAVAVLAESAEVGDIDVLCTALVDVNPATRRWAAIGLGSVVDHLDGVSLETAVATPDAGVRYELAKHLESGDAEQRAALTRLARDDRWRVRRVARRKLRRGGASASSGA